MGGMDRRWTGMNRSRRRGAGTGAGDGSPPMRDEDETVHARVRRRSLFCAFGTQHRPPLRAPDRALRARSSTHIPRLSLVLLFGRLRRAHALRLGFTLVGRLLPTPPSRELGTRDALSLRTHAHDDEDGWTIALSLPAAASPLPLRSATPVVHHAWDAEGVFARLRADVAFALAHAFTFGALEDAFEVRFAPN
jgi:hypothetical protein